MTNNLTVKLSYRYSIDASNHGAFEKEAARLSYEEFKMKSQAYNSEQRFNTFSEMKRNDGRANSLHYKLNFSLGGLIHTLNNKMPVIKDLSGKDIPFDTSAYELLESHIFNPLLHSFVLEFITPALNVILNCGDILVLKKSDAATDTASGFAECFSVKMQEGFAITSVLNF